MVYILKERMKGKSLFHLYAYENYNSSISTWCTYIDNLYGSVNIGSLVICKELNIGKKPWIEWNRINKKNGFFCSLI